MEGEPAPPPPACSPHQAMAISTVTGTPPSSCCTFMDSSLSSSCILAEISDDLFELQKSRLLCHIRGSINRYHDCLCLLQRQFDELNLLRQEKRRLTGDFVELSGLLEDQKKKMKTTGLGFAPGKENVSPSVSGKRIPKSISIRSTGFLTVKNPAGGSPRSDGAGSSGEVKLPHRLLVPVAGQGEGKELAAGGGGAVEMDVYDQGMTKTELCNKWEEMAWCPYGQQCQFAHGIQELRPVIRHPRYKTQLCRMVGLPGGCPYGHRCHFRHASEKHDPS